MTANTPDGKQPSECSNISEIRAGIDRIDRIDRLIIDLLGDRLGYVHEAAKFKTTDRSIRSDGVSEARLAG